MKQHKLTKEAEKRWAEFVAKHRGKDEFKWLLDGRKFLASELHLQKEGLDKNYCKRTGCMVCK